ncbi:malonate decarboxylase holo-ACP synthase [Streptomyces sp. NBC_00827]|uniref:malonate decarboxylase holo-ACP synthase n=1 Tax=Streptomyces sp. NBC_00827 TaxID=2903677 RepID=UPI003866E16B|nr:malonate decarboxylase holo-ACP synthase [Streptomyces sp. NBC_00827]
MTGARAHDLILLAEPAMLLTGTEPDWVSRSLAAAPWVVVRRAAAPPGLLAVGVRGAARHERHAAHIPQQAAARLVRPEDLRTGDGTGTGGAERTAALKTLCEVRPVLEGTGCLWGPVGSVGFEKATGRPATTPTSDLDLVIRIGTLPTARWASGIHSRLSRFSARVDCQIETPAGAVALAELAAGPPRLVLRTSSGPRLLTHDAVNALAAAQACHWSHRDALGVRERP